ncbi:MAG TPA: ATP-binding protein [Stellaceae bacterium]|nr:ATP-binding protein [Stellaceae bacterium]
MIEIAAGILLIAGLVFGALWLRTRKDLGARLEEARAATAAADSNRARLAAILATAPIARIDAADDGSYADFCDRLAPADVGRFAAAVDRLRRDGGSFSLVLAGAEGSAWAAEGRKAASGDAVLWLADASTARQAEAAQRGASIAAQALREFFDALPLPVWRRDRDLKLIDCNHAYAMALDTTTEAALAEGRELAPISGRNRALEMARTAATGTVQSERRHLVIGGSRRWVEVTELPMAEGGTIGFAVDRTEVESIEGELSRHINAHGEVLERIHAGVAIYGSDKRLKFFNSAFTELWGLEYDWLAGEPSLDELLERLRERRRIPELADFRLFKRQQLDMFTTLIEPQHELMHLPDDRTLSVSVSPHPLGGLIFAYEDVTDRLALERSYNTLIEVQRETLDNSFEGIAVFGSDGRLKLHNPAYRKIWALSEADLDGEPHISEIVEKTRAFYDDGGGDWSVVKQQVIGKVTAQTEASGSLDRLDGSVLQMATVPLPDGNALLTCLDVTDTARVERALRERNEALETAGRLKSEFIANVSYELRTPLNAIIGFAEILAHEYFGPLTPRQLDYSRGILDSSHRLLSLINDILDLATIEAGYMALETGRIEIRELLESVVTLTHERARNQSLALTIDCGPDIGVIAADERRLKQALFNLVSNAIKFTPAGGTIRLEARRENGEIVLAVTDTGVGIPSADQERVFEMFERGNPQARQSGAGLGLSLVKSLIELHGGDIEIDSVPGQGTTISCRLPVGAVSEVEPEPARRTVAAAGPAE